MDAEVVVDDGACRVVLRGPVFVQYRWGKLTIAALDAILAAYERMSARTSGPLFGLVILAPDADVPTAPVRVRQKEVLARIARDGRMQVALVVEGEGVFAHLGRTIVTTMTPDTLCYRDAAEAVAALTHHEGAPPVEELAALVATARSRCP